MALTTAQMSDLVRKAKIYLRKSDDDASMLQEGLTVYHDESDSGTDLGYYVSRDLVQSTAFQTLQQTLGTDNDQSASGYMYLYQPSSTTFVKHFISQISNYKDEDYNQNAFVAGYGNTTSAVDAIQFKMSDDEIQGGSISMYGIG